MDESDAVPGTAGTCRLVVMESGGLPVVVVEVISEPEVVGTVLMEVPEEYAGAFIARGSE